MNEFLENWSMKLKCSLLKKSLGSIIEMKKKKDDDPSKPLSHIESFVLMWNTLYTANVYRQTTDKLVLKVSFLHKDAFVSKDIFVLF